MNFKEWLTRAIEDAVKERPLVDDGTETLDTSDLCWRYREISGEIWELGDELEPEEEK